LHLYNGNLPNQFSYYEDDGQSMDYQKGLYCKRDMQFNPALKQFIIKPQEGKFTSHFKYIQLLLHGFDSALQTIHLNNTLRALQTTRVRIIDGLKEMEDLYDKDFYNSLLNSQPTSRQQMITITNSEKEIIMQW